MMPVTLSIIIPTCNAGQDIAACLGSLQGQTFQDFDVHVVDALSGDDTAGVVATYQDRVGCGLFFQPGPDAGVYDAMNKGIAAARGEWLYFMGADDLLHDPAVLADVAQGMAAGPADILYGDVVLKNSGDRCGGKWSLDKLLFEGNICHQALFYRRSVFEKVGVFSSRYPLWADWELNIRCFRHPALCIQWLDRIIALYNNLPGRLSSSEDPVFRRELPVFLLQDVRKYQAELAAVTTSRSYRLGKWLFGWLDG